MDLAKQKGKKIGPIRDIYNKFKYSFEGFKYAYTHETSFILATLGLIVVIILGIVFHIDFFEWSLGVGSILFILIIEFLNTGIEATVDMFTKEFNPLAKIAKDCGSAATFLMTFLGVFVNLVIFIPKMFPGLF